MHADTYSTIVNQSWDQILRHNGYDWRPPFTVHLPIHPASSPDFVHVSGALDVCRRRVYPGMSARAPDWDARLHAMETWIVQVALDDPPFVPDFRLTELALHENRYPIARANYYAYDLSYALEYFCCPMDAGQSLLWIRGQVTNEGENLQTATMRLKVGFHKEMELFDYHYAPFHWDAGNWRPCAEVRLEGQRLLRGDRCIGKVVPGGFDVAWESKYRCDDDAYNRKFACSRPYFVPPAMRLKELQDVIRLQSEIAPGQSKGFALALLVNDSGITGEHQERLDSAVPESDFTNAVAHFRALFPASRTELVCPAGRYEDIFAALQVSTRQLLVAYPDGCGLMPTQGGSSERFYVWVWEAVCMLRGLLATGHFGAVREALDFIFSLQDGAYPPEGRFTTVAGAIGTTGPRWMNSTGSALGLAAEYYFHARDAEFLNAYLLKILRAVDWIIGELRATRRMNSDGAYPPAYGLMPFGCATDGDIGHIVSFTDTYTHWGLDLSARLLEELRHPRAAEIREQANVYKADIQRAVQHMTRADGFIERRIIMEGEESITRKFDNTCGAISFALTGVLDVGSDRCKRYVEYFEEHLADHYFTGLMDREVVYIGSPEFSWQDVYLRMGEWKKAFAALQANLKYGMSQDTFQTQERFSRRDPAFTPWQPNGSGNGRMLLMILKSLYFEYDDEKHGETAILLGGMPAAWLADNGRTALTNLHSRKGSTINLEAGATSAGAIDLVVSSDSADGLPATFRFPDFLAVAAAPAGVSNMGEGCYRRSGGAQSLRFALTPVPGA